MKQPGGRETGHPQEEYKLHTFFLMSFCAGMHRGQQQKEDGVDKKKTLWTTIACLR